MPCKANTVHTSAHEAAAHISFTIRVPRKVKHRTLGKGRLCPSANTPATKIDSGHTDGQQTQRRGPTSAGALRQCMTLRA
mmetsp:Transcript_50498/g.134282  ORF Transcript_50498/g.134282 Transcript_50498/m.134282 type:complete len:80 (+) Transcript_50498:963-1202(+)